MKNIHPIPKIFTYFKEINSIINSTLFSVDPAQCVRNNLERNGNSLSIGKFEYDLREINHLYVIGVGKAVLPMALAVSDILKNQICEGILITKHENKEFQEKLFKNLKVLKGSHPVPTEISLVSTETLLTFLNKTEPDDLVIGLISGGGSALMTYPVNEIGLSATRKITTDLLNSGATINEMNTVRKHLDQVKGGGLLKNIDPARSVHLILSDVIGDPLSMIASGPTCSDPTTFHDCLEIISKYHINVIDNKKVIDYLIHGDSGLIEETLKENDPRLNDHQNQIIGSLSIALDAAYQQACNLGFDTKVIETSLSGEARLVGKNLAKQLVAAMKNQNGLGKPICLIAGGETTVTVKGSGKGGRNQELALSAAMEIRGIERCVFISFATDGEDGPTDAAGGIVTGNTIDLGKEKTLNAQEFLNNNNAYEYLKQVDGLVMTGPTGTNVNDIVIMIAF